MSELSVDRRELEGVVLLYPRGFINAHTVRLFEGEIQAALDEGRYRIVVSGAELKYIASAGLGAIMGAVEETRTNGGDIRLADLNETVRNILDILGFNHLYRIFPSEMEAILSFREGGGTGSPPAGARGAPPPSSASPAGRSTSPRSATSPAGWPSSLGSTGRRPTSWPSPWMKRRPTSSSTPIAARPTAGSSCASTRGGTR